jgi:DHA2 family multidrug resistance protein
VAAAIVGISVRVGSPDWALWRRLDYIGVLALAACLAALETGLKEGPVRGWTARFVVTLIFIFAVGGGIALWRCRTANEPVLRLKPFLEISFSAACVYSFVLGAGLYDSVYLLPLFLGIVRHHTPLEIGEIMIVGGAAQLVTVPAVAFAEKRCDPRLLTLLGYGMFAAGLWANGFMTVDTDFSGLVWPQLLRGSAVMLCLLPTTRVALDGRRGDALTDSSAVFNLMRNLGGAIGIAAIDTIVEQRVPVHTADLAARLQAGDASAAQLVGLPLDVFRGVSLAPFDDTTRQMIAPLVERAAYTLSFNEAWLALGVVFALSVLALPLLRRPNVAVELA